LDSSAGPILVTGGGGQLATDLEQLLSPARETHVFGRERLDVTDDAQVEAALERARPTLVFNCAAFHNVDLCESEEDRSFEVNVRAVKRLAARCAETRAKLVHLSTNYVFDGGAPEPYAETDPPNPRSIYALSKLAGEYAATAYCPGALVVRTAGLYGLHGSASKGGNFITRVLDRANREGKVTMVADQRLSPTYTADLAAGLVEAVRAGCEGLLHLANGGSCSWHEFTLEIMRLADLDVPVEAVETTVRPGSADRPLNGVLAQDRARAAGLAPLRPWADALADYMGAAGLTAGRPGAPGLPQPS